MDSHPASSISSSSSSCLPCIYLPGPVCLAFDCLVFAWLISCLPGFKLRLLQILHLGPLFPQPRPLGEEINDFCLEFCLELDVHPASSILFSSSFCLASCLTGLLPGCLLLACLSSICSKFFTQGLFSPISTAQRRDQRFSPSVLVRAG